MTEFRALPLEGAYEIIPNKFVDSRGFFSETYNKKLYMNHGILAEFVQNNHSFSVSKGVVRGLHFQVAPHAQDKLLSVTRGSIFDVMVDLRQKSETYKSWIGLEVSAEKWNHVLIPKGFAHGFLTIEDNTEVHYKVSEFYAPEYERSIRFDDPELGIEWSVDFERVTLSEKDRHAPLFSEIESELNF